MKSLKNILAAIAFVFAFGAAFALDANNSNLVQKYGEFPIVGCDLGTLNEPNCGTTVTLFGRCTVTKSSNTVDAFDDIDQEGQCIEPLYKQTPQ